MSNEEVIQEVTKDTLANGKHPTVMYVSGTERSERVPLVLYCENSDEEAEVKYHNAAHTGFNFAWSIGVKDKQPIGELEKLFYVEHGSIGKKPDDIEAIRIDCLDVKENKSYISVLRVVRGKRKKLEDVVPYMMPKDGKEIPLIYKTQDRLMPLLEAFMRGYTDGCGVFNSPNIPTT